MWRDTIRILAWLAGKLTCDADTLRLAFARWCPVGTAVSGSRTSSKPLAPRNARTSFISFA